MLSVTLTHAYKKPLHGVMQRLLKNVVNGILKSTINIQQSTINHFFGVITVLPSASLVISMS